MSAAPEPGLYRDVPEAIYRAWPCPSQSLLHDLERSPAHAYWNLTHPKAPSAAKRFGSATHSIVLMGPEDFERSYMQLPEGLDRRTKEGKAFWADFEMRETREGLKHDEYAAVVKIREALLGHPVASQLLWGADGANELSIVWDEHLEAGKLRCKARLDRLTVFEGWPTIVDLKKLEDASPKWIGFRIGDYRYDLQAAMYRRACAALDDLQGLPPTDRRFVFLCVEPEPPHAIALYELDAQSLAEGDAKLEAHLETWARCEKSGDWPGYPLSVQGVTLPEKFWRR